MSEAVGFVRYKKSSSKLGALTFCGSSLDELTKWVEALPYGQVELLADKLVSALREINQLSLSPAKRLAFLGVLRDQVHAAEERLQHNLATDVMMGAHRRAITQKLAIALQYYLANEFSICFVESCSNAGLFKAQKMVRHALHRAVCEKLHLYKLMCSLSIIVPKNFWREFNGYFGFAEKKEWLEQKGDFSDHDGLQDDALTLCQLFLKGLLLDSARTNRLPQDQIAFLSAVGPFWCDNILLADEANQQGLFFWNCAEDFGLKVADESSHLSGHVKSVSFEPLQKLLSSGDCDFLQQEPGVLLSNADFLLLKKHLLCMWSAPVMRVENRDKIHLSVESVFGLSAIHRLLHHDASDGQGGEGDVKPYSCETINVSSHGVCLSLCGSYPPMLSNGALVGMLVEGAPTWRLGMVRWLKNQEDGALFGVESIGLAVYGVQVKVSRDGESYCASVASLLVPTTESHDMMRLLLPRLNYKVGDLVLVECVGREVSGVLEQMFMGGNTFQQFQLRLSESAQADSDWLSGLASCEDLPDIEFCNADGVPSQQVDAERGL